MTILIDAEKAFDKIQHLVLEILVKLEGSQKLGNTLKVTPSCKMAEATWKPRELISRALPPFNMVLCFQVTGNRYVIGKT